MLIDLLVVLLYLIGMVALGWWGKSRATDRDQYLVAGRRLGWLMYSGTMSAVVLGGASTIGGMGLGYQYGISGAWLVVALGLGVLALSALFSRRLVRLRVYTVAEVLDLRYGRGPGPVAGVVMWGYALMIAVTATIAFGTVFSVLFDLPQQLAIAVGGIIVVAYSSLGGMWSVSATDIAQFCIMTVGIFLLLLPISVQQAGGLGGLWERLPDSHSGLTSIGGGTIITYLLIYTFGILIGQDIWQRLFTARSGQVATGGGLLAGVYCIAYAVAGALIGSAARALYPSLANPDDTFVTLVDELLPVGVGGLVLAAGLAAVMSTASSATLACATVTTADLLPRVRSTLTGSVTADRVATLTTGAVMIVVAMLVRDVITALTVAYDLLVGGLLVPLLGGLVWRRGTRQGAVAGMLAGAVTVIAMMLTRGVLANEPIYFGLLASLAGYVVVSLLTPVGSAEQLATWDRRLAAAPGHAGRVPDLDGDDSSAGTA